MTGGPTFEQTLAGWDGRQVVLRHDAETGGWMFVSIHSLREGRSAGGTRLRVYRAPADGLADGLPLRGLLKHRHRANDRVEVWCE